jgi:hypothetical protein
VVTVTFEKLLSLHTPLVIVQRKVTTAPNVNPVTPEVGEDGVVIVAVPVPGTTDHIPVPIVGVFPVKVVVVAHAAKVWFGPATDLVVDGHE